MKKQNAYSGLLTNTYMRDMMVAAPLHDIGKIHIPDAILNKPRRLTEEEFDIMQTHTTEITFTHKHEKSPVLHPKPW